MKDVRNNGSTWSLTWSWVPKDIQVIPLLTVFFYWVVHGNQQRGVERGREAPGFSVGDHRHAALVAQAVGVGGNPWHPGVGG